MRLIHQNYPWSVEVPEENEHFVGIRLSAFHRDTEDWTDPETGEFFPASMRYNAKLIGMRRSDNTHFYTNIWLDHDFAEWPPEKQQPYLDFKLEMALIFLDTFAHCACTVEKSCGRTSHYGPSPNHA